jgi:hypothetical protein
VLYIDDEKIAQTGEPSPFGPSYTSIATSTMSLDLNDRGDHAFACTIDADDAGDASVRNGAPFLRSGETLPAIEPFAIEAIGAPLFLGNDGRLLWLGTWRSAPRVEPSRGLFVDTELLVEAGVTEIDGRRVAHLELLDRSCSMSPSGRYVVFEAGLEDGREGAFRIDLRP